MGSCLDRCRNDSEEECCGLIQGILSSILCRWCCCCRPNQNEEDRTLISCGKSQSTSAYRNQVTGNTCSSGSEDPGDRNIEDDNTEESSYDKESQDTGEINSGESQHDIIERKEKDVKGDIKKESSSAKRNRDAEIDLIVLSPLPEGVKRFYKALEENLRKVRIREVPVNDFMEDNTGKNLVIVICNITTRALSDVTATLDKIKDDMRHRIFLICLHWTNPTEAAVSAAENIVKRDFPSIEGTVDMVYYRIKDIEGLHKCDLNEKALKTIKEHIRDGKFKKQ